jgi:hypothetical protein
MQKRRAVVVLDSSTVSAEQGQGQVHSHKLRADQPHWAEMEHLQQAAAHKLPAAEVVVLVQRVNSAEALRVQQYH